MPFKDKNRQALASRGNMRTYRHGNWRQTFVDCNGMCQYPVNGAVCGAIENLEFHEPFGEIHGAIIKFQQRVLLCVEHHRELEGVPAQELFTENRKPSRLFADVNLEIYLVGSYQGWLDKYSLKEPAPFQRGENG